MKNYKPAILVFILAILMLGSCTRSPDCFRKDVFCAALVTDTLGINDFGINRDTWAALEKSKADGVINQGAYIESVDTRDYEKNIAYFTQKGYDVIITAGTGLLDETLRAADLYPDSIFIGISQSYKESRRNLFPITFAEDQMGFFAGALAARLTKTRVVAAVCETSGIDAMWRYCEGFRAGVSYIDKEIKVLVEYRDDGSQEKLFIDEAWGSERAQYLMKRGADVIFATGGATGQGALRATAEAGIYAIGTERDQAAALGESGSNVVTSVYGSVGVEVQTMMRSIKDGNLDHSLPGDFGYVALNDKFPEGLKQQMDDLLSNLVNRDVQTNISLQKP
jgi:basic membrane protein A